MNEKTPGERIIEGANDALAFARGEPVACTVHMISVKEARIAELEEALRETKAWTTNADHIRAVRLNNINRIARKALGEE